MFIDKEKTVAKWITDLYEQDEIETEDIDFLLSVLGSERRRILEVACGSGRILVPLAKAGHLVTGIDIDNDMLDNIAQKAEGLDNIKWRSEDMLVGDWGNGFDVVVLAGNILFNIITKGDYAAAQRALIEKASLALKKGGFVYIDYGYTPHPEWWFDSKEERIIFEGTDRKGIYGKMILCDSSYDQKTHICKSKRRYELTMPDGMEIRTETDSVKHFMSLEQLYSALNGAGFKIVEEYGNYNRDPIGEYTDKAIIYAEKE